MELIEQITATRNILRAVEQVKANKGCAGIDKVEVNDLNFFMHENWERIKAELQNGTYQPQAVKGVEIPKPNGGTRLLGIPTVIDRVIQQAINQVLIPIWEQDFHPNSYGFRPKKSAHQAIEQAKKYVNSGKKFIIMLDLEKFFDKVNQDKLMGLVRQKISDKKVLCLIRKCLKAGIMQGEKRHIRAEGTPQGSPLSPLLANIMLHQFDLEMQKRGNLFIRYADDICMFVKSHTAARRVLHHAKKFLEKQLKLSVNLNKTKIVKPSKAEILGFSFVPAYKKGDKGWLISIAPKSWDKLKYKITQITRKTTGLSIAHRIAKLTPLVRGWVNYFRHATGYQKFKDLDSWTRNRLRYCFWHDWKHAKTREKELIKLGIPKHKAGGYARTLLGGWAAAQSPILGTSITLKYLDQIGYIAFLDYYLSLKFPHPKNQTTISFL